jgi:LemA protein
MIPYAPARAGEGDNTMKRSTLVVLGVVVILVLYVVMSYNGIVGAEQAVEEKWSQVQNAYQRRADLIPNLVATVKGAANFEQSTLTQVVEARSRIGQISPQATAEILNDPQKFAQLQQAQDGLSSAISRLLVVVERYPELKAVETFQNLMVQVEGSENRISTERRNFNLAARDYNTRIKRFPGNIFANLFGFQSKPYFEATAGAETAPKVDFGTR